jgi:hypothetical protein
MHDILTTVIEPNQDSKNVFLPVKFFKPSIIIHGIQKEFRLHTYNYYTQNKRLIV